MQDHHSLLHPTLCPREEGSERNKKDQTFGPLLSRSPARVTSIASEDCFTPVTKQPLSTLEIHQSSLARPGLWRDTRRGLNRAGWIEWERGEWNGGGYGVNRGKISGDW